MPDPSWTWRLSTLAYLLDVNVDDEGVLPAENVPYDNATSGLTADDVQAAIDELAAGGGTADLEAAVRGFTNHPAAGAAESISLATGDHRVELSADLTPSFTDAVNGESYWATVFYQQDATGGWDVTHPGSVVFADGAPTIDPAALAVTVITYRTVDGGTTIYGFPAGGSTATGYYEPVTNGDAMFPEIVFDDGDIVMEWVPG